MRKRILIACLLLAICPWLIFKPQSKKSTPFALQAIQTKFAPSHKWESRILSADEMAKVEMALAQTYRYLGAGGQCFAFVSTDDQYVIKFIKQKSFAFPPWLEHFPFSWFKDKKMHKKKQHRAKMFSAFKASFDVLSKETGILFIHLNPTRTLHRTLHLCDDKGVVHHLELDDLEFVVQKKAVLAHAFIDRKMQEKNMEGAKHAIDQLIALQMHLYKKGFRNRDPNFRSNWGFIENEPILIDSGRIVYGEKNNEPVFQKKLQKGFRHFRIYLTKEHPELLDFFEQTLARYISEYKNPL